MVNNIEELRIELLAFPRKRVQSVCNPEGATRCKYLSSSIDQQTGEAGSDYTCEKATFIGRQLDYHQRHEGFEGTGNCPGILGLIVDNQGHLMGNPTMHHQCSEDTPGTFTGIKVEEGVISFGSLIMSENSVMISVSPEEIVFTAPYIGTTKTISFAKPQEQRAQVAL
jgi:hypothetical protein